MENGIALALSAVALVWLGMLMVFAWNIHKGLADQKTIFESVVSGGRRGCMSMPSVVQEGLMRWSVQRMLYEGVIEGDWRKWARFSGSISVLILPVMVVLIEKSGSDVRSVMGSWVYPGIFASTLVCLVVNALVFKGTQTVLIRYHQRDYAQEKGKHCNKEENILLVSNAHQLQFLIGKMMQVGRSLDQNDLQEGRIGKEEINAIETAKMQKGIFWEFWDTDPKHSELLQTAITIVDLLPTVKKYRKFRLMLVEQKMLDSVLTERALDTDADVKDVVHETTISVPIGGAKKSVRRL